MKRTEKKTEVPIGGYFQTKGFTPPTGPADPKPVRWKKRKKRKVVAPSEFSEAVPPFGKRWRGGVCLPDFMHDQGWRALTEGETFKNNNELCSENTQSMFRGKFLELSSTEGKQDKEFWREHGEHHWWSVRTLGLIDSRIYRTKAPFWNEASLTNVSVADWRKATLELRKYGKMRGPQLKNWQRFMQDAIQEQRNLKKAGITYIPEEIPKNKNKKRVKSGSAYLRAMDKLEKLAKKAKKETVHVQVQSVEVKANQPGQRAISPVFANPCPPFGLEWIGLALPDFMHKEGWRALTQADVERWPELVGRYTVQRIASSEAVKACYNEKQDPKSWEGLDPWSVVPTRENRPKPHPAFVHRTRAPFYQPKTDQSMTVEDWLHERSLKEFSQFYKDLDESQKEHLKPKKYISMFTLNNHQILEVLKNGCSEITSVTGDHGTAHGAITPDGTMLVIGTSLPSLKDKGFSLRLPHVEPIPGELKGSVKYQDFIYGMQGVGDFPGNPVGKGMKLASSANTSLKQIEESFAKLQKNFENAREEIIDAVKKLIDPKDKKS